MIRAAVDHRINVVSVKKFSVIVVSGYTAVLGGGVVAVALVDLHLEHCFSMARIDADQPLIGGLMSERNRERLAGKPWMTQHGLGGGSVICIADDVTLRGFQHGPMRLLMNAITRCSLVARGGPASDRRWPSSRF